jgi:hypothetical protein
MADPSLGGAAAGMDQLGDPARRRPGRYELAIGAVRL